MRFTAGARPGAADANEPILQLWNPHASMALRVLRVEVIDTGTASATDISLARTTTRGTPGSTSTLTSNNAWDRRSAPASGAVLDLSNFTAAPSLESPELARGRIDARIGAGIEWRFGPRGLWVPPESGLAVIALTATTGITSITFDWLE